MLKLTLCILFSVVLGVVLLELRQQRLELNYQNNRLHAQIAQEQSTLWQQQLQIARSTAPDVVAKSAASYDVKLVPTMGVNIPMTGSETEEHAE